MRKRQKPPEGCDTAPDLTHDELRALLLPGVVGFEVGGTEERPCAASRKWDLPDRYLGRHICPEADIGEHVEAWAMPDGGMVEKEDEPLTWFLSWEVHPPGSRGYVLCQFCPYCGLDLKRLVAARWMVVFKRDDAPAEVSIGAEEDIRRLYDLYRLNWSDVYLVKVVEGPVV